MNPVLLELGLLEAVERLLWKFIIAKIEAAIFKTERRVGREDMATDFVGG